MQRVRSMSPIRSLLPDILERLPQGGEHLGAYIDSTTPLEAAQCFPQRQPQQANGNLSSSRHRTPNGLAPQQAYQGCQMKARSTSHQHSENEGKDTVSWFHRCRSVFLLSFL